MYMLESVSGVAKYITAYEVSIKPRLPFSNPWCVLCFHGNLFDVYYTTLSLVLVPCGRVAAVERLPVHHHSADYISFPLGSLGPLWYVENGVLLM